MQGRSKIKEDEGQVKVIIWEGVATWFIISSAYVYAKLNLFLIYKNAIFGMAIF